ncbi:hypothetical protein DIURU_002532 [Diutina rugosa]|uniref:Peptide hydrolase n=1 Tax=Diutina rugosa TaxID=5481 RepID=A0A642UQ16_DIURU|nr:uncharacterized protein DIURU_002532 [Diutina rugosa]KAA8903245.1 hypothetical protein DIURU_002532 [Diutina rugosa]
MNPTALLSAAAVVAALPVDVSSWFPSFDSVADAIDFEMPAFPSWGHSSKPEVNTHELQSLITEDALRYRAEQLFNISKTSIGKYGHPTRVIGSPGHWNTINYILRELIKLDGYYTVRSQALNAIDGKVKSVSLLIEGRQPKSLIPFRVSRGTEDGRPVHGKLVLVKNYGCNPEDFPKHSKDNIVLIERGECPFGDKSFNAGQAGAKGAIIFDKEAVNGRLNGREGEIATVSISKADAQSYINRLIENPTAEIETTLYVDAYVKNVTTVNVIAETKQGDHNNVVSLGAHSDSVEDGPGINDDGSGTISLLEVAKHLTNYKVNNAVRFAWWAAEEEGLVGSTYYAEHLSPKENEKIRLFMDYDMMASPNYEYEVYDANNKDHPAGSGDLKQLYIDWYKEQGLNYTLIPFDGRSDYVGFIENGIPAGGIATGAEGVKSKKSKEQFGGVAGEWFDKCYHQLCDDLSNPNYEAWVTNTKLIAHSVATYAKSLEGFPKREKTKSSESKFSRRGQWMYV